MNDSTNWKAREIEILELLAQGLTNSQIGARLHLSYDTIRWYNKQIFEKLAVSNRLQAVNRAAELGLLDQAAPVMPHSLLKVKKSPVQYVVNGDVHLAYQIVGDGPIDLLFIHGFLSHLELAWENEEFARFFTELGQFARIILFDKRGVGLSDRIQGAPTLATTVEDARCVLDAAQSDHAVIMGTSEGAAAAVLLSVTYPERVMGLILYAAVAKVVRTGAEPAWANQADRFRAMITHITEGWGGPWAVESFAPSKAQDEAFRDWWAMILRAASSPSSIKAVLERLGEVDIRALLPKVAVKSLVIHKQDDRIAPLEAGRYFATNIPDATWIELPGADHIYFIESTAGLEAIHQFCQATTGTGKG
ncbi:MAG: alpha/beta fold hydrolase [Anaerolineales bacterium]|nr:alpha/beta fold hydrolase [Anaerolineales bacterium]